MIPTNTSRVSKEFSFTYKLKPRPFNAEFDYDIFIDELISFKDKKNDAFLLSFELGRYTYHDLKQKYYPIVKERLEEMDEVWCKDFINYHLSRIKDQHCWVNWIEQVRKIAQRKQQITSAKDSDKWISIEEHIKYSLLLAGSVASVQGFIAKFNDKPSSRKSAVKVKKPINELPSLEGIDIKKIVNANVQIGLVSSNKDAEPEKSTFPSLRINLQANQIGSFFIFCIDKLQLIKAEKMNLFKKFNKSIFNDKNALSSYTTFRNGYELKERPTKNMISFIHEKFMPVSIPDKKAFELNEYSDTLFDVKQNKLDFELIVYNLCKENNSLEEISNYVNYHFTFKKEKGVFFNHRDKEVYKPRLSVIKSYMEKYIRHID